MIEINDRVEFSRNSVKYCGKVIKVFPFVAIVAVKSENKCYKDGINLLTPMIKELHKIN